MVYPSTDVFLSRSTSLLALLVTKEGHVIDLNARAAAFHSTSVEVVSLKTFFSDVETVYLLTSLQQLLTPDNATHISPPAGRLAWAEWQIVEEPSRQLGLLTIPRDRFVERHPHESKDDL